MLIDSHCHLDRLDLTKYAGKLEGALQAAHTHGVEHMLCVCIDTDDFAALKKIADKYDHITLSAGVHPTERPSEVITAQNLLEFARDPKVVGIGETGLDYYRCQGDMSWQQQRFREHIYVAKDLKKPLIIHTRAAQADTIKILKEENAHEIGGVFHCFTETWEMAEQALDLNFYISFSGIVTFKNARELQEVALRVPLEKMLIETDSPYLAPVPHRGKPNEPAYVLHVAEFIAQLRNESFEKIAAQTTENFYALFHVNS